MYGIYPSTAAVNPANMHPNCQLIRSPPQHQQQPIDQQRNYGNGRNSTSQQASSAGTSNSGGRAMSTTIPSGQIGTISNDGLSLSPQYTLNGAVPNAYAYGGPPGWTSASQQISSHTNMSSQINGTYNIMFDPSQQAAYLHRSLYDTLGVLPHQLQAPAPSSHQQAHPQPGLDTVPQGNYNR